VNIGLICIFLARFEFCPGISALWFILWAFMQNIATIVLYRVVQKSYTAGKIKVFLLQVMKVKTLFDSVCTR
jgi:hypothetical protein